MKRILVTHAHTPLGQRSMAALRVCPDVEQVHGIVATAREARKAPPDVEVVPLAPDHRPLAEVLGKERIDTVVQCGLVPDRTGMETSAGDADVIGTMCVAAALAGKESPVRSWVVTSSSAIYPIDSHMALMQTEQEAGPLAEESPAAAIAEAEDYARDVAIRQPHLNVAILRLQQLAGDEVRGALIDVLRSDPVPIPIGFDPLIQLLHVDDAASAVAFAARNELAGLYNVASAGVLHWGDAVRATGRRRQPVLPIAIAALDPLLSRVGVPHLPAELVDLMRFGHAIDTRKLEGSGWRSRIELVEILQQIDAR